MTKREKQFRIQQARKQREWMRQHGGDMAGYVDNYVGKHGSCLDRAMAIYMADANELRRFEHLEAQALKVNR